MNPIATDQASFRRSMKRRTILATVLAALFWASPGFAQGFTSRPIRLVLGFSPGGGVDAIARILAPHLGEALNTTVIVENKVGASGAIATEFVARSEPDGYTVLLAPASAMTISPQVMKVPFNVVTDFTPINLIGGSPLVIAVNPSLGVHNLKELLQLTHTRKVTLGSAGYGTLTHLTIELLSRASPGNIIHVPYKGGGAAVVDAVAGHVDGMVSDLPPLLPMFQAKRLIPIAVTTDKRVEFLPETPTVGEDLPGFVALSWSGLFAPAKTPREQIDRINAALVKVVARDDVIAQLKKVGVLTSTIASPDAFKKYVAEEHSRWGKVVKEANIVAN
ncbi:tripartite tricarboxylate transporter substrate binding protein [Rhodoferax sediminis]|uniref:Tripartite tricarboxylate transporter substrate binding protein n=2 Tax=Rhodoferax sediminis TaxID=2509614 RepID=A0A515DE22_9BURK|nr:tripartite tricarboxylate transporter substrate binding protein [Rhodoferax sediminis]